MYEASNRRNISKNASSHTSLGPSDHHSTATNSTNSSNHPPPPRRRHPPPYRHDLLTTTPITTAPLTPAPTIMSKVAFVGSYTGFTTPGQLGWVGTPNPGVGISAFSFDDVTGKLVDLGKHVAQDSPTWLEVSEQRFTAFDLCVAPRSAYLCGSQRGAQ